MPASVTVATIGIGLMHVSVARHHTGAGMDIRMNGTAAKTGAPPDSQSVLTAAKTRKWSHQNLRHTALGVPAELPILTAHGTHCCCRWRLSRRGFVQALTTHSPQSIKCGRGGMTWSRLFWAGTSEYGAAA
jgi:hypothetical protein